MICLKCGQENDDREKYCIYCHAKLKKTSAVDLIDEEEDVPVSPGEDPSLQTHTHNYLVIVAILCVAIAVSSWFLIQERNAEKKLDLQGWLTNWFHAETGAPSGTEESGLAELESEEESWQEEADHSDTPSHPEPSEFENSQTESSLIPEQGTAPEESLREEDCSHSNYVFQDEIHHRCTRCGQLEEHIWYVDNDAVYCRRCDSLKEYIHYEEPDDVDPQYQRLMTVIITGQYLNIRSGPGEEYSMLSDESMYYRHQYVEIYEISYDGMWGRVRWNDQDGWIYLFYTNGLNELGY